jgi:translation elongation factor EF-4
LQFVEVKMRYGGDISKRKMKTEKRKKTASWNVEIPQEAFMAVLKLND